MQRRQFLASTVAAASGVFARDRLLRAADSLKEGRKIKYVGWQVGVTYQAIQPGGLPRDYLLRLVDEMAANRMNLISLQMQSYGYFDPMHDGYCWPVRNEKLRHYRDSKATNADASTEFIREVISAAVDRGITVQLMMNWGIWNPERIRLGYPDALSQAARGETNSSYWLHCPDSRGAWQAGLDEVADLLDFYKSSKVTSYVLERISYGDRIYCFCKATQELFRRETGKSIFDVDDAQREAWKVDRITAYLGQYAAHLQRLRPGLEFWLHSGGARGWGHDPKRLAGAGINCLAPHFMHFREDRRQFYEKLASLTPNPCVLHFCVRDRAPQNYNIWVKTPEIIHEAVNWLLNYPGENLAGMLFFNEPAVSPKNKKAVYEEIKRFSW